MRLAGAPISWGVSEVPGWGHRMDADRVLAEMRAAGLAATELGPPGFLPRDREAVARTLARHGLSLAAGFIAVVLHEPGRRAAALAELEATASAIAGAGGTVLVVAAASNAPGYERHDRLEEAGWAALAGGLRLAGEIAGRLGLTLAVHPHAGTAVERHDDVRRLLERTGAGVCLDTGHLAIAGADPLEVAIEAGTRVRHVHLKDVDATLARRVRDGDLAFAEAVCRGLFRPLGDGDVDVAGLVRHLDSAGYDGWCTVEQDAVLDREPAPGLGPALDTRRSVAFLERLAGAREAARRGGP